MKKKRTFFGIGTILPYLKRYRAEFIGIALASALGSLIDIGVPLFQRYALNRFVALGSMKGMPVFAAIYLGAILAAAGFNYISCIWGMKVEVGVERDLRDAAFSHLQTLSFSYFNQNSVGYIHSRIMSDTQRIGELLSWTLLNSAWQLCYVVGSVIAMFVIAYTGNNANVLNYKTAIINEYSGWEEDLDARERELKIRESELKEKEIELRGD